MRARIGLSLAAIAAASVLSGSASAALLYGNATETGSRFNPGLADTIVWMNAFVDTTNGNKVSLTSVDWGIRRLTSGGVLIAVDVELFVAEMTFDGTNFGVGPVTNLGIVALAGGGTASLTQIVTVNTNASLALEMVSNPGLGGMWVGLRFAGPNFANTINGWRVVNAPAVGASINAFGMSNWTAPNSGFDGLFAFGNPPGSSPSRFLTNINGSVIPAPGAFALLGVAGLLARRRRN